MFTLELSEEEREELLRVLETELSDTRIEYRRTRNPDWRDRLEQHENRLSSLLERLKEQAPAL